MKSKYRNKLPGGNSGQQHTGIGRMEEPSVVPAADEKMTSQETVLQSEEDIAHQSQPQLPPAVEVSPREPQEYKKTDSGQDDGNSNNWKDIVGWFLLAVMFFVTISAVWQCHSLKNQWKSTGYEEGRRATKPVIDSLQAVIVSWQEKWKEDGNRASYYAMRIRILQHVNNKAEATEFFRQLDDYRNMSDRINQLEIQNNRLGQANQNLQNELDRARKIANDYADAYDNLATELATVEKKLESAASQRKPKAKFYTIREKERHK